MRKFTDAELTDRVNEDTATLEVADGFYGLKMYADARAEVSKASEFSKMRPDFLELWSLIHAAHGEWQESLECAETMIVEQPDNPVGYCVRADAIRHLTDARAAYKNLAGTVEKFPKRPLIQFNLGCYASVAGNFFSARRHLIQMFRLADDAGEVNFLKNLALDDDLKPLWPEIPRLKDAAERLNRLKNRRAENRLELLSSSDN
jgi:hypothetical protein